MKSFFIFILFMIYYVQPSANEDLLDYFYVEDVYINKINTNQIKEIDPVHKYVVAYAYNTDDNWKKSRVGVFLVSKVNGVSILDMFPPTKKQKLIPVILQFSPDELIVGIYNEFTEIKKIKYLVNFEAEKKVVSRIELKFEEVPNNLKINKAITIAENNKYEEALRILAPCLKANPTENHPNLEDCLFYGEEIADKAFRHLLSYFNKDTNLQQTYGNYRIWFATLGIKTDNVKYAGTIYTHNYLETLKNLFPISKYQDVFEYKLLERGVNDVKAVKKWIDSLISYRTKYPRGRYIFNATTDLANAYDNLWELLTPDSEEPEDSPYRYSQYYSFFSTGNTSNDLKDAEKYRDKALKLYKHLKTYGAPKGKHEENLLQESIQRIETLTNKERSNSFYILND